MLTGVLGADLCRGEVLERGWAGAEERTVGGGGATLESRHSRDRLLLYLIHLVLYWLSTFINIGPILSAS